MMINLTVHILFETRSTFNRMKNNVIDSPGHMSMGLDIYLFHSLLIQYNDGTRIYKYGKFKLKD